MRKFLLTASIFALFQSCNDNKPLTQKTIVRLTKVLPEDTSFLRRSHRILFDSNTNDSDHWIYPIPSDSPYATSDEEGKVYMTIQVPMIDSPSVVLLDQKPHTDTNAFRKNFAGYVEEVMQ